MSTIVFVEFQVKGNSYLLILKRIDDDGSIRPGRRGSFFLYPGAIHEHTVVLDSSLDPIGEPLKPVP